MDAWLSTLLLAAACALWILHADRRRDQRRRAALAIAERVMRRSGWGQVRDFDQRSVHTNSDLTPNSRDSQCDTLAISA